MPERIQAGRLTGTGRQGTPDTFRNQQGHRGNYGLQQPFDSLAGESGAKQAAAPAQRPSASVILISVSTCFLSFCLVVYLFRGAKIIPKNDVVAQPGAHYAVF